MSAMMLTNYEMDMCRDAFMMVDADGSGTIDIRELSTVLNSMGQHPTDEELFNMINQVDDDGNGQLDFPEFLKVVAMYKESEADKEDESDTVGAFVALGGNSDKSGCIRVEKLRKVINDFELLVDIEELISVADADQSGFIDYQEFKIFVSDK